MTEDSGSKSCNMVSLALATGNTSILTRSLIFLPAPNFRGAFISFSTQLSEDLCVSC